MGLRRRYQFASPRPRFSAQSPPPKMKPPYKGAPKWECSAYYFWWAFLKRNAAYIKCCERKGLGRYAQIYRDWGDIRDMEFKDWWFERGRALFSEPDPVAVHLAEEGHFVSPGHYATVNVPLSQPFVRTISQLRKLITPLLKAKQRGNYAKKAQSRAPYRIIKVHSLAPLHECLRVFDAVQANPGKSLAEIADIAGLLVSIRNPEKRAGLTQKEKALLKKDWEAELKLRKKQEAFRHLKKARKLVRSAIESEWPIYKPTLS